MKDLKEFLNKKNGEPIMTLEQQKIFKEFNGLSDEDYKLLVTDGAEYVDTDVGRVFCVRKENMNFKKIVHHDEYLRKVGQPEGVMSLSDTATIADNVNGLCFIADLRVQAVKIEDLLQRSLDKSPIISIKDFKNSFIDTSLDVDNPINNITLIASSEYINSKFNVIKENESYDQKLNLGLSVNLGGFSNTKENPINQDNLRRLMHSYLLSREILMVVKKDIPRQDKFTSSFEAIEITNDWLASIGSKEKGFYVEIDDKVEYIKNGELLKCGYIEPIDPNERPKSLDPQDPYIPELKPFDQKNYKITRLSEREMKTNNLEIVSSSERDSLRPF
jgi:hypothetical protein